MTVQEQQRIHATCVAYGGRGVLLLGSSGSGKSDLALRMISQPLELPQVNGCLIRLGAGRLVADDQVIMTREAGHLIARPPRTLAGQLEARGLGIVALDHQPEAEVVLMVELVARDAVERMPPAPLMRSYLDVVVPMIRLHAFDASTPAKVALALIGSISISR